MQTRRPWPDRVPPEVRARWQQRDLSWAQWLHRGVRYRSLEKLLIWISALGDGAFWVLLVGGLLLLDDPHARDVGVQMMLAGAINFPLYFWLKRSTGRPRPFARCDDIRACARVLDRFSFPSGHTQHAVAYATICIAYFPSAALLLIPFVLLVALSRVTLGLHYPSDVAAGALIGAAVGSTVLALYY